MASNNDLAEEIPVTQEAVSADKSNASFNSIGDLLAAEIVEEVLSKTKEAIDVNGQVTTLSLIHI